MEAFYSSTPYCAACSIRRLHHKKETHLPPSAAPRFLTTHIPGMNFWSTFCPCDLHCSSKVPLCTSQGHIELVSIALQKVAAGLRKGLGQGKGLRGWITWGNSASLFISSWQRWEGIVFLSVCAELLAQPVLTLTVHAACNLASLLPGERVWREVFIMHIRFPLVRCQAASPVAFRGACVPWGAAAGAPCAPFPQAPSHPEIKPQAPILWL